MRMTKFTLCFLMCCSALFVVGYTQNFFYDDREKGEKNEDHLESYRRQDSADYTAYNDHPSLHEQEYNQNDSLMQSQAQPQLQEQLQTEAQAKTKLEMQIQAQTEQYAKAYAQAQAQIQAQAKAQAETQAKVQAYAQAQAEAYAQEQVQMLAKIQAQAQIQAQAEAQAKAQAYVHAYTQAYSQAQVHAQNIYSNNNALPQVNFPNTSVCNPPQIPEVQCQAAEDYYCEEIACPSCETCCSYYFPWDITAKVGWVFPVSEKLRHFYSSAFPIYEIEGSYRGCKGWGGWANVGYATKKGHAKINLENCTECEIEGSHLKNGTRLHIVQLGLGAEYTFNFPCSLSAYLGAGITYSYLWIKNDSKFAGKKINKNGVGGIVKSGLSYYFYECLHADLFLDYTITQFNLKHFDYQTINFGIGIGASF